MKKVILFILVTYCYYLNIGAQSAYYLHLSNKQINVFYTDMVDSMVISDVELKDGESTVVQNIYTQDSVFSYDISEIDSISFVTPQTIYKQGVVIMEEKLLAYLLGCDSLTLVFDKNLPSNLCPKVSDKLVCLQMTDILPNGFAGEVVTVERTDSCFNISCKLSKLSEIFERYYGLSSTTRSVGAPTRSSINKVASYGRASWHPQPFEFPMTNYITPYASLSDPFGNTFSQKFDVDVLNSFQPSLEFRTALIVTPETGTYLSFLCTGYHTFKTHFGVTGTLEYEVKPLANLLHFPIPLGQPLLKGYVEIGPFARASASLSLDFTNEFYYKTAFLYNWSSKGDTPLKNVPPTIRYAGHTFNGEGSLKGTLQLGGYLEFGIEIADDELAKLYAQGELGVQVEGNGVLYKEDVVNGEKTTTAYDKLLASGISGSMFGGLGVGAEAGIPGVHVGGTIDLISGTIGKPFWDYRLAPKFTNLETTQTGNATSSFDVSMEMDGQCFPIDIGFVVKDEEKNDISESFVISDYMGRGKAECYYTFSKMPVDKQLTVYPIIKILDNKVLAKPSAKIKVESPVKIEKVEVTKASYYPNHYTYNGKKYSFQYKCSTTATVKEDENIEEWGYMYEDPDGNKVRVPLTEFGSSYTDARYAYCRNENKSTIKLYGYVKYKDDEQIYYSEPQVFDIEYPEEASVTLTSCNFLGTDNNVSFEGKTYKYKSSYKYYFKASGAYWLKVGTAESGTGWNLWELPNYTTSPVDGSNALTVNYYYDDKEFAGDYNVYLEGVDATHSKTYETTNYVTYTYSDNQFTGCTFNSSSATRQMMLSSQGTGQDVYNIVINKFINK